MLEAIQKIFESPAGSFSFVLGIMILAGWLIHYATKFVTKISVEHGQFDKRMEKAEANIDQIKTDVAEIKGIVNIHKTDIAEMKVDIAEMKGALIVRYGNPLSKKKSPVSLTDEGEKMVSDNHLDVIVNSNWDRINTAIKRLKTQNPYDIQEFCRYASVSDTINVTDAKFFSEPDIDKLKIVAFKSGYPVVLIAHVMGILIRDRYFAENRIAYETGINEPNDEIHV